MNNRGLGRRRLCTLYNDAAKILKSSVEDRTNSLRAACFASETYNQKLMYKVCSKTVQMVAMEDEMISRSEILKELYETASQDGELWLFRVLLYEFMFGSLTKPTDNFPSKWRKQLNRVKPEKRQLKEQLATQGFISPEGELSEERDRLPRYGRVNNLKTDTQAVVQYLKDEGWQQLDTETNRKGWKHRVLHMEASNFVMDLHFADELIVFPPGTDLHDHPLVVNGNIILQDKASMLPVLSLNLPAASSVIDACAAPGIKSTHIAGIIGNYGKIYAFDKDISRVATMKGMLKKYNATTIVNVENMDFLKVDVQNDQRFADVEYALVDPPCSGSGIASRPDSDNFEVDARRLNSLGNVQAMLCKHALKLPKLKRLAYSTCSIHERENEQVIKEIVEFIGDEFELIDPMKNWKHRGRKGYAFSRMCLRASPDKDLTNGFFVAIFQRRNIL